MIKSILFNAIIMPLILLFEVTYEFMFRIIGNEGLAIIAVSLVVNFLCLPLYRRADVMQAEERDRQQMMKPWVKHIKKYFKGTEQHMMLTTYYRQVGYSQTEALRGSISLLLQIPFFTGAYIFLSNLQTLSGVSFLFIKDLSLPDQLFTVGGFAVNVLPIAMTLLNCVSGFVYTRGLPARDKIQTYGLAILFLVLLYNSPAGLVFYWTCNQVFSLLKNIFFIVIPRPRAVFNVLSAAAGVFATIQLLRMHHAHHEMRVAFSFVLLLLALLPSMLSAWKKYRDEKGIVRVDSGVRSKRSAFVFVGLLLGALMGLYIPAQLIGASPVEFISNISKINPNEYIISSFSIATGVFLVWGGIIYYMCNEKGKRFLTTMNWVLAGVFLVDFFFFGKNMGYISAYFVYDKEPAYSASAVIMNLCAVAAVILLCLLVARFRPKLIGTASLVLLIAMVGLSVPNMMNISRTFEQSVQSAQADGLIDQNGDIVPVMDMSRKGKNVVVIMLDRAINSYIPYIFSEHPELKEQFDGFTYYPNTTSFGKVTVLGAPPLFGGYEYTPAATNERKDMTLIEKHNEALKVMPTLFAEKKYGVTVIDPPFVNYSWETDLSIYDDLKGVNAYKMTGVYTSALLDNNKDERAERNYNRNLFCYGLFKTMPLFAQPGIYDKGTYFSTYKKSSEIQSADFLDRYSVLYSMDKFTRINDGDKNNFVMMQNSTPHNPIELQLPDYTYSQSVDNSQMSPVRTVKAGGKSLHLKKEAQYQHYHVNAASIAALGKWFKYLQDEGIWDNTKIILVSDHAFYLDQSNGKITAEDGANMEGLNALMMVKDYDSHGFKTSDDFMTVADTPTLATEGAIKHPVNPYTGKEITDEAKDQPQLVTTGWSQAKISGNKGYAVFNTSDGAWYEVQKDIFDSKDWTYVRKGEKGSK